MASDTRPRGKIKDKMDANSLKRKITIGKDSSKFGPRKDDISGVRRLKLAGETSLTRHNSPIANIGKRNLLSSYSVSNQSAKTLSVPELRRKKEKSVIQVTMEAEKVEIPLESVGMKRKKMTGHNFKALFKRPCSEPSRIIPSNKSPSSIRDNVTLNNSPNHMSDRSSSSAKVDKCGSKERKSVAAEQKSLYNSLQGEMTILCQTLKFSEDVIGTARRFLDYVITNHHISTDSPAIVQASQISLCWIAASISNQKVDKKKSLMLTKDLLNYQCTEEQVHSVFSKIQLLRRTYLQCPENAIDSVREEDISKDTSNVNEGRSHFSSSKLHNVNMKVDENFANEEHYVGSEIDTEIKEVQKRCDNRMKKLIRKQREEIKELYRIWEEKRLRLENDHKLELALVRSIHGQCSERLKILDDDFAKKIEEHNILKDVQLKDIEAKQKASKNMEREKAAHWLAEAKACCSIELRPAGGTRSLHSQSEGDAGCSETSSHVEDENRSKGVSVQTNDVAHPNTSLSVGERVCEEIRSVELDKEIPQEVLDFVPNQTVDIVRPVELCNAYDKGDAIVSTDTFVNPRDGPDEAANGSLPSTGLISEPSVASLDRCIFSPQKVPRNKNQQSLVSAEPKDRDVPAVENQSTSRSEVPAPEPIDIVTTLQPITEIQSTSQLDIATSEHADNVTAVNLRDGTDKAAAGSLPLTGQMLEPSVATPDRCVSSPQQKSTNIVLQVPHNKIQQSLVSAEPKDQDAPAVENQSTSQSEVSAPESIDTVTTLQPSPEIQSASQIDIATSEHINNVTAVNQRDVTDEAASCSLSLTGQLLKTSVATPDRCVSSPQQVPQDEIQQTVENQSTSPSEVPEPVDTVTTLQPNPQIQSALQIETAITKHIDTVAAVRASMELEDRDSPVIENQGTSQNSTAMSQMVNFELPIQTPLQLGIDPTDQVASRNSPFFLEPLQNELEKICKETEQLQKCHEDVVLKLKSDWEKESAQLRNKYEMKLQDAKAEFRLKKIKLDKNQNKVVLNKVLSEYFRSICFDPLSAVPPGIPSSYMQHMHQLSLQHSVRFSPGASASQPAPWPGSQIGRPSIRALQQQQSLPHSTGFCNVSNQNVVGPPVQVVCHAADLFSGAPSTPPVISAISRAGSERSGLVGGYIHSAVPHLQSSRSISLSSPHQLLHPAPPLPSTSQNGPELLPPQRNTSISAVEMLMDMDHRPHPSSNHISSNVRGNMNSSAVGIDVICLSDDEQHLEAL
ncbi:hypothetical protein BUALT_Bualt02G0043700 [Buddleja alternifolia]|uniref:MOM1 alpha-helical domain-containing protein n=1 Tax=Buddleja alternifolia TaxID=168488 RepID=A0AAV6Y811_9LAMI|nr:hypothetical protein BUALT_Bualt02G0043700 [Buddleja alternifolia]